jgi:hypothetical protein
MIHSNYSGSREEVQLLADKSFGQPEKKLNFWLSSYDPYLKAWRLGEQEIGQR